ncbi:hypothetical protein M433DRAFT_67257 [Acidomyces richmondensis BFW]|nr:MAG: hypothetical protein FE78DRAFT_31384 [Acidomyces sp. 'richmondensis']KYG45468.1 hypothetical protein M433DRAFT_67257 [Acidomyces richmondensis BFW]
MVPIVIRPPTFSPAKPPADYQHPSISWLSEIWHVTHSTLPMWKNKRNVRIQYTPLEPTLPSISKENTNRIDDVVTYQGLSSEKIHTVAGIDICASTGDERGEWNWRGKGWLKIVGSHWEILGWGEELETKNKWLVTIFAKTLFTPAGIDVYSKDGAGISEQTLTGIMAALASIEDENVQTMASHIFEINRDEAREGR